MKARTLARLGIAGLLAAAVAVPSALALQRPDTGSVPGAAQTTPAETVSPWGVATSHGSAQQPGRWLPQLAAGGVTALRGFSERGDLGTLAAARGIATTGFLTWSPGGGALTFPINDLTGWQAYVERTVRAQPRVRQWEVWNEPPNFTANPSPAAYARLVQVAYRTIKSVDAGLQVGLATKSTHLPFLAEALDAGAAGNYDFVTLHPYERIAQLFDGWDEDFFAVVGQTRAMLAVHDPGRRDVPVDFTEMGAPAADLDGPNPTTHMTPSDQAAVLVKAFTLALAQGVRRAYWYDAWDGDASAGERPFGLIAADGTPRPSFVALHNLVATLGSQPRFTAVRAIGSAATILEFATPRGPMIVAWSHDGATLRFTHATPTLRASGKARAPSLTLRLRSAPVIVPLANAGAYTWSPHAPRAAAPAADGSYDVQWTAASGSAGLLVRGAPTTTAQGRAVLDLSTSSGLDMAVVPPRPSWTPVNLQVEVTARAVGAPASVGLRYDAASAAPGVDDAGQAAAGGWRPVRPGAWRTYIWNISSARLAGIYGVNLKLTSAASGSSRCVVSQVRVHAEPVP